MYRIGEQVIHRSIGLCEVVTISELDFGNGGEYYTLVPARDSKEKVYVAVKNADRTLRPVMTREEAEEIFMCLQDKSIDWNDNNRVRDEQFKQQLRSGSSLTWAVMLKNLYRMRCRKQSLGQKLSASDTAHLNRSASLLVGELAAVLETTPEEIYRRIEAYQ